jgi:predicted DNA-binding protein YlxM (UPF0122 family)
MSSEKDDNFGNGNGDEFDPDFQPLGYEQEKFRDVVEAVFNEEPFSKRMTDLQKEFVELRFLKNLSLEEIAPKMNFKVEDVKKLRNRNVKNILYIFKLCKVEPFKEKNLIEKLKEGDEEISSSFETWQKEGKLHYIDVEVAKKYSSIFNGFGDYDIGLFSEGYSDKNALEPPEVRLKLKKILGKVNKVFYGKHFN